MIQPALKGLVFTDPVVAIPGYNSDGFANARDTLIRHERLNNAREVIDRSFDLYRHIWQTRAPVVGSEEVILPAPGTKRIRIVITEQEHLRCASRDGAFVQLVHQRWMDAASTIVDEWPHWVGHGLGVSNYFMQAFDREIRWVLWPAEVPVTKDKEVLNGQ